MEFPVVMAGGLNRSTTLDSKPQNANIAVPNVFEKHLTHPGKIDMIKIPIEYISTNGIIVE